MDSFLSCVRHLLNHQKLSQSDADVHDLSVVRNILFDQELMASKEIKLKTLPYFDFH